MDCQSYEHMSINQSAYFRTTLNNYVCIVRIDRSNYLSRWTYKEIIFYNINPLNEFLYIVLEYLA